MKRLNFLVYIVLSAGLVLSVACGKKDDKAAVRDRSVRDLDPNRPIVGDHTGGGGQHGQQQAWGKITAFSLNNLGLFLNNPGDLGNVSNASGADTGVRFTGQMTQDLSSGWLEIQVWDDRASQEGPFRVGFNNCRGYGNSQNIQITCDDNYGQVTLSGQNGQSWFAGGVSFTVRATGGNQQYSLGEFRIQRGSIVPF